MMNVRKIQYLCSRLCALMPFRGMFGVYIRQNRIYGFDVRNTLQ